MAKLLKLRRGTTSEHSSFTGAEGEATIDTTKDTLVVHDGSTAGGRALLREDVNNLAAGAIAGSKLTDDSIAEVKLDISNTPTDGYFLKYKDSTDKLTWAAVSTDLSGDTTPQLGGNLDVNTKNITFGDSSDGASDDALTFGVGSGGVPDLSIYSNGSEGILRTQSGGTIKFQCNTGSNSTENFITLSGASSQIDFHKQVVFIGNTSNASWDFTNSRFAGTITEFNVTANNSTDETVYPLFADGATGSQGAETDTGFTYNPSSGNLTIGGELDAASGDFSGDVDVDGTLEADAITVDGTALNTVIAGVTVNNATTAANVTVADESTDTTCFPTFVTAATGDLAPKTGDNLTFNSSTGALVATIVEDSKGNVRSIPINTQANAYTIAASDAGKTILASNTLYVNNNTMQIGDAVTIINNTAGNITITKQITTMYWTADGTNATRTLATRGSCTILYTGNTECYISGSGLS